MVTPTGKAFGIQIKTDDATLAFDTQEKRDYLYGSSMPFFLGVVSRQNLRLTVYNTLNRLHFFWMLGPTRNLSLAVDHGGEGIPRPDKSVSVGGTGKPILEIGISDPDTPQARLDEIEILQATMQSWVALENKNLSLKERGIALLFWPTKYTTNKPIGEGTEMEPHSYTKYAGPSSLPHVCRATEEALTSLSFYLRKLPREDVSDSIGKQMEDMHLRADSLRNDCESPRREWDTDQGPPAMPSPSSSW